jgi:hypothetical protein
MSDRKVCPACGSPNTEHIEYHEPSFRNDFDELAEGRACNDCYAGYNVALDVVDKAVHTEGQA